MHKWSAMQLVYCYIGNFRNIVNQEVVFNHDFDVSFSDGNLRVRRTVSSESKSYLYGESQIKNLSVIVGRTGSGKTNLLQLIGMDARERMNSVEDDSYFLLYYCTNRDSFVIEYVRVDIQGLTTSPDTAHHRYGRLMFYTDNATGRISRIEREHGFSAEDYCVVNSFDRYSFADCPYEDVRRETIRDDGLFFPRIISAFGKSYAFTECILLKNYIDSFDKNSIKHKASFEIRCENWQHKLKTELDDRLYKNYYWTFKDKVRYDLSPKYRFTHDLMVDFAIYLRKWIEGMSECKDTQYELSADYGKMSIIKRLEALCQFIDMYSTQEPCGYKYGLVWQIGTDIVDIFHLLNKMDDKYFTGDRFSIPVDEIDLSEGSVMGDLFERIDQYRPDEFGIFTKELLPFHWTHISSGEYQYAKVWGQIEGYGLRMKVMAQRERYREARVPDMLMLMDEPETYMHPELCRRFVHIMSQILQKRPKEACLQIIVSTHSPFILSDLLSEQIVKMDYDADGLCKIYSNLQKPYFAANIHSIMADGFFLRYTIGEQARLFLQSKFDFLKSLTEKRDGLSTEEKEEVARLKEFAPAIGDDMIRYSFEQLLEELE